MFAFFIGVITVVLPWECEEVANGDGYSVAFVSRLFTNRDKMYKLVCFLAPMETKVIGD